MSHTITIVTGSNRPNSTGEKLIPLLEAAFEPLDVTLEIANLRKLNMPFVDSELIPADPHFAPTHDSVRRWQEIVENSDGLVMLTPQYNMQMSAVQKNAIDWLYREWKDKPVAMVGYSWSGGDLSMEQLDKLLIKVGAKPLSLRTQIAFKQDIDTDGTVLDDAATAAKLRKMATTLFESIE